MISRALCRPLAAPIARALVESGGSSGPTSLPDAANRLGSWFATDYSATPVPYIPNRDSAAAVSAVINAAPRRMFGIWYGGQGSRTITDDAATAPDGSSEASTIDAPGNWRIYPVGANFPAGTYTMAVNAKRNTGTDQVFAFAVDNANLQSPTKTATAAWQRFSWTFTLDSTTGASHIVLCSPDGSTGTSLQIVDFEIYEGSSDLGPTAQGGHMKVGSSPFDTAPTYASGAINLSTGGYGFIHLAASETVSEITAMAVVSKVDAGSAYNAFLSKVQAYNHFSAMTDKSGGPYSYIGAGTNYGQGAGMWGLLDSGYHCLTHRNNGVTAELWLDDVKLFSADASTTPYDLRDMYVGLVNGGLNCGEKIASIALWKAALSDDDVRSAVAYMRAQAEDAGLAPVAARIYCAEGDSITAAGGSHAYLTGAAASPAVLGCNFAVPGATLSDLNGRSATVDAVIPPDQDGRAFILSVLIGANDLLSAPDVATYAASLASYCDARRAAGYKVIVCTLLPKTNSTFNTARAALNTILRTWVGTHADAIADFAANATMGVDAAASNASLYYDGTHPTEAGYAYLGPILTAAVDGL